MRRQCHQALVKIAKNMIFVSLCGYSKPLRRPQRILQEPKYVKNSFFYKIEQTLRRYWERKSQKILIQLSIWEGCCPHAKVKIQTKRFQAILQFLTCTRWLSQVHMNGKLFILFLFLSFLANILKLSV